MTTVKEIIRGNVRLVHERYRDDFGMLKNRFNLIKTEADGRQIHMPFYGIMKVTNYDRSTPIGIPESYTDEEYEEMFDQNLPSLKIEKATPQKSDFY